MTMSKYISNNFIIPCEVREDVVNGIVDVIISWCIDKTHYFGVPYFTFGVNNNGLYLSKGAKELYTKPQRHDGWTDEVRVRGCEIEEAFSIMNKLGYYFYKWEADTYAKSFNYKFDKKPCYDGISPCEDVSLDIFID